jgi:hypothetical protein
MMGTILVVALVLFIYCAVNPATYHWLDKIGEWREERRKKK